MRPHHGGRHTARTVVIAIALAGTASTLSAQPTRYKIQDLSPDETSSSSAVAINNEGIIGGSSEASRITRAVYTRSGTPFLWVPGLQVTPSAASGVNAAGDLTGYMQMSAEPWIVTAFRYTASGGVVGVAGEPTDGAGRHDRLRHRRFRSRTALPDRVGDEQRARRWGGNADHWGPHAGAARRTLRRGQGPNLSGRCDLHRCDGEQRKRRRGRSGAPRPPSGRVAEAECHSVCPSGLFRSPEARA